MGSALCLRASALPTLTNACGLPGWRTCRTRGTPAAASSPGSTLSSAPHRATRQRAGTSHPRRRREQLSPSRLHYTTLIPCLTAICPVLWYGSKLTQAHGPGAWPNMGSSTKQGPIQDTSGPYLVHYVKISLLLTRISLALWYWSKVGRALSGGKDALAWLDAAERPHKKPANPLLIQPLPQEIKGISSRLVLRWPRPLRQG